MEDIRGNGISNDIITSRDAFRNGSSDVTFKNLNEYLLKGHKKLSFGVESNYYDVTNELSAYTSLNGYQENVRSATAFLHSAYFDFKNYRAYDFFTFSLGTRASYFTGTNKLYVEPRVMANFHINKYLTGKINGGVYHQYINHIYGTRLNNLQGLNTINWQLSDGRGKPVVQGLQTSAGFIWNKSEWIIDVEGYYKETKNITSGNFFTGDSLPGFVQGGYNTRGVDLLLKKKIKNIEAWVGYSYMDSDAKFDTLEFKYVWNQTHLFNFVLNYNIKNFKISTGWKYMSGFVNDNIRTKFLAGAPSFIFKNPSTSEGPTKNYVDGSAEEYDDTFPDSHQMDLSISYFLQSKDKNWKLIFGGTITNIYDNRLIISQTDRPVQGPPGSVIRVNKTGFGRLFNATIKVMWR